MFSMRSTARIMAAGLGVVACDQGLTPVAPKANSLKLDPFRLSNMTRQGSGPIDSPFGCAVSFKTADGPYQYAYRRITFGIPAKDLAPDGSRIRYALRVENAGEAPVAAAYRLIPNTPQAIAYLDRNIAHRTATETRRNVLQPPSRPRFSENTLPTVYVYATPDYWYGGGGTWDDTGWDNTSHDSGGDYYWDYNPDLTPPAQCYPNTDSLCLTQLTHSDSVLIQDVLQTRLTPLDSIGDSTRKAHCQAMLAGFNAAYTDNRVFRGAFNTGLPGDANWHYSAADTVTKTMHFDPWLLDSAATGSEKWKAQLANSALHEAAHILGKEHPAADGVPFLVYGLIYVSDWFSDLNFSPQKGGSCIIYQNQ